MIPLPSSRSDAIETLLGIVSIEPRIHGDDAPGLREPDLQRRPHQQGHGWFIAMPL